MQTITQLELFTRTDGELAALFSQAARSIACTKEGSVERHRALTSLENVRRELAQRPRRAWAGFRR